MSPLVSPLCLLLVVTLFHFCFSIQNFDHRLCIDDERRALLEFKHGLIDEANRLGSWVGEESDCCKWAGITCDNSTGHVHRIHLRGLDGQCDIGDVNYDYLYEAYEKAYKLQRLRGDINPSLLRLKQLKHLDLSCNDFGGIQVPTFISSLGELTYLNLSNSGFSGVIPSQLGNLSKLHVLSLGYGDNYGSYESTSMSDMHWLSSLRLLTHLEMNHVDLSKTSWVQVINTLPSLVELHMSHCKLYYIDPHVPINNLTSLTLLDLSYNNFSSYVPWWIFSITSLVSLDLSGCYFHNDPVRISTDMFRNLTALKLLHVRGNDFMNSSSVLKGLSSSVASNLISLDTHNCDISSPILDSLHNFTSILRLDVSKNRLTKTIPRSFGNLCNLIYLDMSDMESLRISLSYILQSFFECQSPALESLFLTSSGVSGHLPDQLRKLINLKYLELEDNQIVGTIPDSIGHCTSMRELSFNRNLISGPIPSSIGRLLSLELLDISSNQLNGSIPESLGQLSKLIALGLSNNLLNGVVTEAHFDKLVSLKVLDGNGNNLNLKPQLSNWIPPFQAYELSLKSWGLGDQFPLWIQSQKDLTILDIGNTDISEYMPESFLRSFTNLNSLDMSKNRIRGTLLSLPSTLHFLDLSSNEFGGKLTQLFHGIFPIYIDLSHNLFAGTLHHFLCSNGVKETNVLSLGSNDFSGVIPECWDKWPYLEFLNLNNNHLSGGIPTTLGSLATLESLSMGGNKLSGKLPASLMNLRSLLILQLARNDLVRSIPTWFGTELSSLRLLNLRSNHFQGNIPNELCYLTKLRILDIAHNNLGGNIPRCINNFSVLSGKENISVEQFFIYWYLFDQVGIYVDSGKAMATDLLVTKRREDTYSTNLQWAMFLDLSSNNLFGHIPSELTTLVMLNSLNLSSNQLTGRIPDKIGDMKKLESFDLSLNKLSGELPTSLSGLSFFSSFNVSYNYLSGRVPLGTQLEGFNESSFFGNKLCGAPLSELCAVKVPYIEDQNEEEEGAEGTEWGLFISILLGLVVRFWIVVAPLIVSRSWRTAYFRFFSKLW